MKTAKHDLRVLGFDIKGTKTNRETMQMLEIVQITIQTKIFLLLTSQHTFLD